MGEKTSGAPKHQRRRLVWRPEYMTYVLLVLVLISLAMNLWAWLTVSRVREIARQRIDDLASQVESASHEEFAIDLPVRQSIPVQAQVPINKTVSVPISLRVPIKETFNVPLETPFGTYSVPVPIDASIPVSTTVPVVISETLDISTTIDLDTEFPIRIPMSSSPLASYLQKMHEELLKLRDQL